MRNLILSAFPGNMRLPDPFTPNLKVDTLTDINQSPRMHADFASLIQPASFKKVREREGLSEAYFLNDLASPTWVSR